MLKRTCKIMLIFAFAIGFVSGAFLTTRYHFTVYNNDLFSSRSEMLIRVHFFTKIQIRIFHVKMDISFLH